MPKCPQCTKPLTEIARRCPSCQADLDLLVDYVSHLQGGLQRAENLTRAGELGQAIWAYLEVLEVDPDNPQARRQIGQVITAVREFDALIPGRRWLHGRSPRLPLGRLAWWHWAGFAVALPASILAAVMVTLMIVQPPAPEDTNADPPPPIQKDNRLGPAPKPAKD